MDYDCIIMLHDNCWIKYFIPLPLIIIHRIIGMDHLPHITIVYNILYATIDYSVSNDYIRLLYSMITIGFQLNKHVI